MPAQTIRPTCTRPGVAPQTQHQSRRSVLQPSLRERLQVLAKIGWIDMMRFFSNISGLNRLAARYPAAHPPEGQKRVKQTVQIGAVRFRRCVTVHVGSAGLHLHVRPIMSRYPPVLIPWEELREPRRTRIYWQTAMLLAIGNPQVATIRVPATLFRHIDPYLKPPHSAQS